MRRWCVGVAVLGVVMTDPDLARADTGSTQAAQVLFEEGRKLMAAGHLAEACPKFAESQKLDPGAGTLLNLALCYEKRELYASAWVTYTEAAGAADQAGRPEWLKRAKEKTSSLAPLLSTMTIVVSAEVAKSVSDLTVTRDGRAVSAAEWGIKVPVDGGDHVIEAHAAGHEAFTTKVNAPAKHGALTIAIPALHASATSSSPPTPTTTPPPEHSSPPSPAPSNGGTQRILGIVTGGLGLVAVGAGTFLALNARSKHEDAKSDCNADETQCGASGLEDYNSAVDSANGATIAFVVGGVLIVGGVVLFATAPSSSGSASSAKAASLPRLGTLESLVRMGGTF